MPEDGELYCSKCARLVAVGCLSFDTGGPICTGCTEPAKKSNKKALTAGEFGGPHTCATCGVVQEWYAIGEHPDGNYYCLRAKGIGGYCYKTRSKDTDNLEGPHFNPPSNRWRSKSKSEVAG